MTPTFAVADYIDFTPAAGRTSIRDRTLVDPQLLSRAAMAVEVLGEWLSAHGAGNLPAAADAIGDRLFILLGDAVATGLPLPEIFERVYESNSTKLKGVTNGLGKAVKGPGYVAPSLAELVAEYDAHPHHNDVLDA